MVGRGSWTGNMHSVEQNTVESLYFPWIVFFSGLWKICLWYVRGDFACLFDDVTQASTVSPFLCAHACQFCQVPCCYFLAGRVAIPLLLFTGSES